MADNVEKKSAIQRLKDRIPKKILQSIPGTEEYEASMPKFGVPPVSESAGQKIKQGYEDSLGSDSTLELLGISQKKRKKEK